MISYWFHKLADAIDVEAAAIEKKAMEVQSEARTLAAQITSRPLGSFPYREPDDVRLLRTMSRVLRKVADA